LGELYTALGRPQLAVDNYIKAAEKEKDSDITQFEAAQKCFDAGRYDCALKYVDRALALSTKDSYVALREAILVLAGQAAAAPADPAARAARAKIYLDHALEFFQAQDYEKALAFADRGVALSVDGRLAIVRGFVLLLQRKYEEAERDFRDGRGQQPLGAGVGTGHLAIVRHAYREAEAQLEPGRRHDEKRNTVWKSPEERRRDFDWFLYRLACLGLAWSNANQNQHEKAIAFYNLVLSFEPADFLALLGKGNSFSGLRQLTLAEETFAGLLKAWPDNPYVLAEMALVKYNRGEDEAAERYFREALKRDDQKYTCPYEGLGLIYLRQGKLDKARQLFERAIAINPNIEYKKFNGLAKIYIKEGRFDEAEKLLRKSIENYPYDTEAKDLLQELQARRRQ
jgi:tetratricopeptide (TPR) repeat protein